MVDREQSVLDEFELDDDALSLAAGGAAGGGKYVAKHGDTPAPNMGDLISPVPSGGTTSNFSDHHIVATNPGITLQGNTGGVGG